MKRSTIAGIIFGFFLFTALYFILTNNTLVFEMFEGTYKYTDHFLDTTVIKTSPVSLGSVIEGKSALTFYGYMKVVFVLFLIPVLGAVYVRWRINRKLRRRENIPSSTND